MSLHRGTKKLQNRSSAVFEINLVVGLFVRLRLDQTGNTVASFPLTTLFQQAHTLEAFENVPLFFATAAAGFETRML